MYVLTNLENSILENGYLPIDKIVAREIKSEDSTENYVILEENRRLSVAKKVSTSIEQGTEEAYDEIRVSLEDIPILIYTGSDPEAAWIFQG